MSQVVSFHSFKGGVGRSLLLANLAVSLAELNLNVMCVDFNLPSGGLHNFFGLASEDLHNTVLDLFHPLSPEDVTWVAVDLTNTLEVELKAGKLWLLPTVAEPAKLSYTYEFAQDLGAKFQMILNEIESVFRPDFVLVDCPAGFSESASGPILKSDYVICVLKANNQDTEGTRMLLDILSTIGKSPVVILALNQVPGSNEMEIGSAIFRELGSEKVFNAVVPFIRQTADIYRVGPNVVRDKQLTQCMKPIVKRLQGSPE